MDYRELLLQSFDVVTEAVHPNVCVPKYLPDPPEGRLIVVGAGKASAAMAAAFEDAYDGAIEGLVITRYGHGLPTRDIRIVEAAHPVPDLAGQQAVGELLELIGTATPQDLIVCLISGGGSSLLSKPVVGITFDELQDVQRSLLGCGASIHEMNIVRKHLNVALGGGLAQAAADTMMITLAISDVVGDDPDTIASGASVADPSSLEDAREILQKYDVNIPDSVKAALHNSAYETPKPGDAIFEGNEYHLIAKPKTALEAAQKFWNDRGFDVHIWDTGVEGDSEDAAIRHVNYLKKTLMRIDNSSRPYAVLSGGETTMRLVSESGLGGPNSHFMLQAAILLGEDPRVYGMACDTDGIDGNADHAGAIITPDILALAAKNNVNPNDFLSRQDSHTFFKKLNSLVQTGPTYTNVNDYRVFLLLP